MKAGTFDIVVTCDLNGGTKISQRVNGYVNERFGICNVGTLNHWMIVDLSTGKCVAVSRSINNAKNIAEEFSSTMDELTDIVQKAS